MLQGKVVAQPLASDSSHIIPSRGEAPGILYYQYVDNGSNAIDSAIRVWQFSVRDGGPWSFDPDNFPTVLDSLVIHVRLVGYNLRYTNRSIAAAELFTADSQLVVVGTVTDSTLVFKKPSGPLVVVPDDSTVTLSLYLRLQYQSVLGDQFSFSIGPGDAFALNPAGETSRFRQTTVAASDTTGILNKLVTKPKSLIVRTFDSPLEPNVPFGCEVIAVDTLFHQVPAPPGLMTISVISEFGTLSGPTSVAAVGDKFLFKGLTYPYRNDNAVMAFVAPGYDTLLYAVQFTGGDPQIPTVTNVRSWMRDSILDIAGTGASIQFLDPLPDGSFLTERFDTIPPQSATMPLGANTIAPRYFRLTSDRFFNYAGSFIIGLPFGGLTTVGNPYGLKILSRSDSNAPWSLIWRKTLGGEDGRVFGTFESFGEFGFGASLDVALPVQLVRFDATNSKRGIELDWSTASEVSNAGYGIARANVAEGPYTPLADYQSVPALQGMGTSPFGRDYSWTDAGQDLVVGETYYYRLSEYSLDGTVAEHGPIAIAYAPLSAPIPDTLYSFPNPFTNHVTLRFLAADAGDARLLLYDAIGRQVAEISQPVVRQGMASIAVDGVGLPAGSYQFVIISGTSIVRGRLAKIVR